MYSRFLSLSEFAFLPSFSSRVLRLLSRAKRKVRNHGDVSTTRGGYFFLSAQVVFSLYSRELKKTRKLVSKTNKQTASFLSAFDRRLRRLSSDQKSVSRKVSFLKQSAKLGSFFFLAFGNTLWGKLQEIHCKLQKCTRV